MINEKRTLRDFGYTSKMLSYGSNKLIYVTCSECKNVRVIKYRVYINRKSNRCFKCSRKYTNSGVREIKRGPFNIEYFQAIHDLILHAGINELRTFKDFGYYSQDLTHGSSKLVWAICPMCQMERLMRMIEYTRAQGKCKLCAKLGKKNPMYGKCGEKHPHYGKHLSDDTKSKLSIVNMGKHLTDETRQRMSATRQGITYEEWESYATNFKYCPLFNESCRESNREKYNRKCYICGLLEIENITSTRKHRKLSVHHVDMNKNQGCSVYKWKLIPVCIFCHNKLHNKRMISCIEYIMECENNGI